MSELQFCYVAAIIISMSNNLTDFITQMTRDKMRVMRDNASDFFRGTPTRDELVQAAFEDVVEDIQDTLKSSERMFKTVDHALMDEGVELEYVALVDDPTYIRQLVKALNKLPNNSYRLHVGPGDEYAHAIDLNWDLIKRALDQVQYAEFLEMIDELRDDDEF